MVLSWYNFILSIHLATIRIRVKQMYDGKINIAVECNDCLEKYNIITESQEQISYCIYCGSFVEADDVEEVEDDDEYDE